MRKLLTSIAVATLLHLSANPSLASNLENRIQGNHQVISKYEKKHEKMFTRSDDPRKVRNSSSPKWMEAMGKLIVRKPDGSGNQCTINLVSMNVDVEEDTYLKHLSFEQNYMADTNIAVTSAHCFDLVIGKSKYIGYRNVIQGSTITFKDIDGTEIQRGIKHVLHRKRHLADGDFAIVVLDRKVSYYRIKPLMVSEEEANDMLDETAYTSRKKRRAYATVGGYSADINRHTNKINSKKLTYHEDCKFTYYRYMGAIETKCHAYGGASGGAAVVTVNRGEDFDDRGEENLFIGINAAVNTDDQGNAQYNQAIIVPFTAFEDELLESIVMYNKKHYGAWPEL